MRLWEAAARHTRFFPGGLIRNGSPVVGGDPAKTGRVEDTAAAVALFNKICSSVTGTVVLVNVGLAAGN